MFVCDREREREKEREVAHTFGWLPSTSSCIMSCTCMLQCMLEICALLDTCRMYNVRRHTHTDTQTQGLSRWLGETWCKRAKSAKMPWLRLKSFIWHVQKLLPQAIQNDAWICTKHMNICTYTQISTVCDGLHLKHMVYSDGQTPSMYGFSCLETRCWQWRCKCILVCRWLWGRRHWGPRRCAWASWLPYQRGINKLIPSGTLRRNSWRKVDITTHACAFVWIALFGTKVQSRDVMYTGKIILFQRRNVKCCVDEAWLNCLFCYQKKGRLRPSAVPSLPWCHVSRHNDSWENHFCAQS